MDDKEFLRKVQEYGGIASQEEAARITEAFLETLGERLSRTHREHLAAQLPAELRKQTLKRKRTERFSLEQFYHRVSARAKMEFHPALRGANAVMRVLRETIAEGELRDILSEVTEDFRTLIEARPPLPISPHTVDAHQLF